MTLTLLLDLDNTLLSNDMDTFLPAYLQGLGRCLSTLTEPKKMVEALLFATQRMIENNHPHHTLKEVFDTHFYPTLNLSYDDAQQVLTHFYTHEYPHLRTLTKGRPSATTLIEYAFQQHFQVAIATNPLFPATAIHQRLEWAGLPPSVYPFDHITTYETSHFAKPNPAYFAEILAYLGWPDGPVLIVGDDLERDIVPAQELGVSSYWIDDNSHSTENHLAPTGSGSLADLLPWLKQTDLTGSLPTYHSPTAILATLRATPAVLSTWLPNLSPTEWDYKVSQEAWNLTEIFCHMRDAEKSVNLPRLQQILNEDNPFIAGVDTDSWVADYKYCEQDGPNALADFINFRLQTISLFENLAENDWQRPARHAIFGPTHFQEISHFMAEHDRLHIRQIHTLINATRSKPS